MLSRGRSRRRPACRSDPMLASAEHLLPGRVLDQPTSGPRRASGSRLVRRPARARVDPCEDKATLAAVWRTSPLTTVAPPTAPARSRRPSRGLEPCLPRQLHPRPYQRATSSRSSATGADTAAHFATLDDQARSAPAELVQLRDRQATSAAAERRPDYDGTDQELPSCLDAQTPRRYAHKRSRRRGCPAAARWRGVVSSRGQSVAGCSSDRVVLVGGRPLAHPGRLGPHGVDPAAHGRAAPMSCRLESATADRSVHRGRHDVPGAFDPLLSQVAARVRAVR